MKKLFALVLAVMMLLSLAAAEVAELEFAGLKSEVQDVMKEIIADYEATHPDVKITFNYLPDGASALAARIANNDVPDILNVYPLEDSYRAYYDNGYIIDLSGEEFINTIEPTMLEMCEYKGAQIGVPVTLSTYGVYYNKDIYAQLGLEIPTTIEGLIANAKACKEAGYDGFTLPMQASHTQISERLLGAFDGNTHEKFYAVAAGEMDIHDVPSVKTYGELILALLPYSTEDALGLDYNGATADFTTGKAAMRFDGSWFLNTILTANPDMNFGYFAIPASEGDPVVPVNVDTTIAISASTKYPEIAKDFVAYLCTPEVATKYYKVDGNINMTKGVAYDKEPLMDVYNTVMAGNMSITQINRWGKNSVLVRQDIGAAVQSLIADKDIEAYYDAVEAAICDNMQ